ncbi:MAG: exodeoxyribonuclease III [Planctomycetota bacterium]|nr:exodeoxyribonuclease III [Planctomycetota bacterium]
MRILSWNVNGLRACEQKGFSAWLEASGADIVGIQEVRALPEQLPPHLVAPPGWHTAWAPAARKGYSGVALFSRLAPDRVETSLGEERFDVEGRLQLARFGRLVIANAYFPNGNGKDRDNSRIPYKLDFYRALYERVDRLRRGGLRVLVLGDFNTAHRAIDLARPKDNVKTSGFRPEECAEFERWIAGGWIDTFRHYEPGPDHYSWWSQRFGVRARNVGWRIDYVLASRAAMRHVQSATLHPEVMGSDHCPVGVEADRTILG